MFITEPLRPLSLLQRLAHAAVRHHLGDLILGDAVHGPFTPETALLDATYDMQSQQFPLTVVSDIIRSLS